MSQYISEALRNQVSIRANHRCEYCLISQDDTFHTCHIDHIISIKHGGPTIASNLAFACQFCNRNKGSDVGSFMFESQSFVRFFNPRTDVWAEHFFLEDGMIIGKTEIGKATVKILDFNTVDQVIDRKLLMESGRYP